MAHQGGDRGRYIVDGFIFQTGNWEQFPQALLLQRLDSFFLYQHAESAVRAPIKQDGMDEEPSVSSLDKVDPQALKAVSLL